MKFFAVRGVQLAPEGDALPAPGARPAPEPAPIDSVYVTCDHCGCKLNRNGEIVRMGDEARRHNKQDEAAERLRAELATATARVAELGEEIAELKRKLAPAPAAAGSRY